MDWQPIETAPKETDVLVCFGQFGTTMRVLQQTRRGAWVDEDDGQYVQPTHWMPLPPTPAAQGKAE